MPAASDFCQLVQQDLIDIAMQNAPILKRQQFGLLEGLESDTNTAGFDQIATDPGNGKPKKVKVRYMQPIDDTEVSEDSTDGCTSELETTYLEDEVEVSSYLRLNTLKFDKAAMRLFCESPAEYRATTIMSGLNAFFSALNKKLIAQYVTKAGVFVDGTVAPKSISLLNQDASGKYSADFYGEATMLEDFAQMLTSDRPIVAGAGLLAFYARMQEIGCCNDLGQDISQIANSFLYYRDNQVGSITGDANNFFAWNPGSVQLIKYLENRGDFRDVSNPHHQETTLVDPFTGMEVDMQLHYDQCAKEWLLSLGLHYDLHPVTPDDGYPAGHVLEDTNGMLRYLATVS